MTYLKQSLFVAASGLLFIAAAQAQETQDSEPETAIAAKVIVQPNTQVLAAISTSPDVAAVRDESGQLYYNHSIPSEKLSPVTDSVEAVETYSFEYNGRTYTNRVVAD